MKRPLPHLGSVALGLACAALALTLAWEHQIGSGVADAHAPHPGLDFSMGADVDSDGIDDCSTRAGEPTPCTAPQGGPFVAHEYLDSLGDIPAFINLQLHFGYEAGVQPGGSPQMTWSGCYLASVYAFVGYTHVTCGIAPGAQPVTYLGLVGRSAFVCSEDGSLNLMHGLLPYHTYISAEGDVRHAEAQQTMEMLDVTCAAPQPLPADADGDGCPDVNEASSNPGAGGLRNFFNPWDYFNPTGDGKNRVDDILAVVQHYGEHQIDGYDRTYAGPNAWNLGPPDGQVSVMDILAQVMQYNHDCG